ncbi:hypothetical protein FVEG_16822 [Fusarium verticillioides 7600]|uniref:Uncharacterized protein n=1 Tax=Gibberella moniliformis (strain M3125 / FGSC 7600) TaxID=334819 RepID=W7MKI2_GIBM7|nr:hypothetical protein FVEG_16822 [Fusarium verticillioides 7600]EWG51611.1 hypothetical protein FVEG_16822 [Fusarium verticillioides 7600]
MGHIENNLIKCGVCKKLDAESPTISYPDVKNGRPCKGKKKDPVTNIKHVDPETCSRGTQPDEDEPDEPAAQGGQ